MRLSLVTLLVFFSSILVAQNGSWELAKNKDGITIHTRKVEGIGLKQYQVELEVEASIKEVVAWIKNVSDYSKWSYKMDNSIRILSDQNSVTFYAIQRTPWPAKDRDICCRLEVKNETQTEFHAVVTAIPDFCDPSEDFIRVPSLDAEWVLKSTEDGGTHIVQTVLTDPGGTLPDWMANAAVTDFPMKTFLKLKELLAK